MESSTVTINTEPNYIINFYTHKDIKRFKGDGLVAMHRHYSMIKNLEVMIKEDLSIIRKKIIIQLDDKKDFVMDLASFYINMSFWCFNVIYNETITTEDIVDFTDIDKSTFNKTMDRYISKFINLGYDLDAYKIIAKVKEMIISMTSFYGTICANTFNLYDIMAFETRNKRFSKLFNTELDPSTMSFRDMELYLTRSADEMYSIIMEDKKSTLYPYVSTNILNKTQMGQMFIAVGPRADMDKTILPVPVKRNVIRGLTTVSEYFVESISTRNSLIIKKESVPDSGYLSRKTNIACMNLDVVSEIFDCGSRHYIDYTVYDQKYLEMIQGKYMVLSEDGNKLKSVEVEDTHLIGKTIKLRSHTKCHTGHTVGSVCCVCLGVRYKTFKDSMIGGNVSIKLINRISQLALQSKHFLSTKSKNITDELIVDNFIREGSSLYLKKIPGRKMVIEKDVLDDIMYSSNFNNVDFSRGYDFTKLVSFLYFYDNNDISTMRGIDLTDKHYTLHVGNCLINHIRKLMMNKIDVDDMDYYDQSGHMMVIDNQYDHVEIDLGEIEDGEIEFFNVKILTEEVSKYINDTKQTIEVKAFVDKHEKPEDLIYKIIDIVFKAGIPYRNGLFVHIESLVMSLMRDIDDKYIRPDYSDPLHEPDVQFLRLDEAIHCSDLCAGLIYENIKRKLVDIDTLKKKRYGIHSVFFKNTQFYEGEKSYSKTQ